MGGKWQVSKFVEKWGGVSKNGKKQKERNFYDEASCSRLLLGSRPKFFTHKRPNNNQMNPRYLDEHE